MLDDQAAWSASLCCGPRGSRRNRSVTSETGGWTPTGTNRSAVMAGTVPGVAVDVSSRPCLGGRVTRTVAADYLVVGAGAMGMGFTDALIDHADVRVAIVDRRHDVGGHCLEAYPFVRLHQSSSFYGVASTVLGGGRRQLQGPEAGLHERADRQKICAYYGDVLADRMTGTGRVDFFPGCDYVGDRTFVSRVSGRRFDVPRRCRVVDARYLAPHIPAETPPAFDVGEGARVIAVNDLVRVEEAPGQYVVVGSGKTATDACIWLRARGVDPDAIVWVRPRDPWMLNRAVVLHGRRRPRSGPGSSTSCAASSTWCGWGTSARRGAAGSTSTRGRSTSRMTPWW
jgi:hypothetical protein